MPAWSRLRGAVGEPSPRDVRVGGGVAVRLAARLGDAETDGRGRQAQVPEPTAYQRRVSSASGHGWTWGHAMSRVGRRDLCPPRTEVVRLGVPAPVPEGAWRLTTAAGQARVMPCRVCRSML